MSKNRKYLAGTLIAATALLSASNVAALEINPLAHTYQIASEQSDPLVLFAPGNDSILQLQHRSHASHSSHASHRSHASHFSGG